MIDEIEDLKVKANQFGEHAAVIETKLMAGIDLPFIKRHELEVEMYDLRLSQSRLNLQYHEVLAWAKEQKNG